MEKFLPVFGLVFAFMLLAAFLEMRSNGSTSYKWAKIRVRTEENRRKGFPEPREEEYGPERAVEWLVLGAMLLLICMLLSKV